MAKRTPLRALILGGAGTLHDDRDRALKLFKPDLIIACNHAARDHEGEVDAWATMHPDLRDRLWLKQRARAGLPTAKSLWHPKHRGEWRGSRPIRTWGGSSGMLCIAVGYELGCTHLVLAGVPLSKMEGHYDDPKPWIECRQYHSVWKRTAHRIEGRVKSMSGWTRDLLGEPTAEWLDGDTT